MVNYHAGTTGNGIVPNNTVHQIVAGLEIARAPATSGLNLAASNACVTNTYKKIGVGSSFNALINSGIVHPTGCFLFHLLLLYKIQDLATVNGNHHLTHAQLLPPLFH